MTTQTPYLLAVDVLRNFGRWYDLPNSGNASRALEATDQFMLSVGALAQKEERYAFQTALQQRLEEATLDFDPSRAVQPPRPELGLHSSYVSPAALEEEFRKVSQTIQKRDLSGHIHRLLGPGLSKRELNDYLSPDRLEWDTTARRLSYRVSRSQDRVFYQILFGYHDSSRHPIVRSTSLQNWRKMSPAAWTRRIRVRTLEEPSLYFRSFSLESRRLFLGRFETYRVTLEHPLLQPTLRPRLLSTIPEGTIQPRALAQGYRSVGKATGILEQLAILCRATLPVMAVLIGYEVFLKEKTEENPFNRGTHLVAAVTDLFKPWPVAVFEGMIG